MRRPTRTRRLSIAVIVSLLAFAVVVGAGVRSYWNCDAWQNVSNGKRHAFVLACGCAGFMSGPGIPFLPNGHTHFDYKPGRSDVIESLWHFEVINSTDGYGKQFGFEAPLWPLLLLLLIAPVRWLIARPTNAPAFPVVADIKQAY